MAGKRYRAFISYSQSDKAHARRLHQVLENYRMPRGIEVEGVDAKARKLGRFFRDDEEMGAAADLGEALRGAIADAECLIVICSPRAAQSRWVNEEIIHFKRTGRADRIFAVIVAGEPHAAREDKECFPPALRFELDANGALTDRVAEPLALDVRKENYSRLATRLVAGLARTPFDALWRREQRRSRARVAGVASAVLLVALVVGVAATQNLWRPRLDAYLRYGRHAVSTVDLQAATPGATFQDCARGSGDCPVMVVIPEGSFLMGDAPGQMVVDEQGRQFAPEFAARHRISIRSFAVSQNEITFADWEACVAGGGCRGAAEPSDSGWGRENRPVINVSWQDAQTYVAWLSQATGHEYRLLTEAEWEYAARGVTSADDRRNGEIWSFGNDVDPIGDHAWFLRNSDFQTHPVGARRANPFGLHDVHGNVWEWVQDCHSPYESECSYRVLRGGSWNGTPETLRSANRDLGQPTSRYHLIGFRVARTL